MQRQTRAKTGTRLPLLPLSQAAEGASTNLESATNAASEPVDDQVMISGRGSQLDPVRVLQGIFKKQEPKRRRPGVNRIAEKYKNVLKSASASICDA